MSQSCVVDLCESTLGISCHCCDKIFCPDHLNEHYEVINEQLNPLVNEINNLTKQITQKTKEKLIGQSLQKLETWRDESHQMIDRLYGKKRQELEQNYAQKTEKQRKEIDEIQSKINKLIHEQNTTEEDIQLFKTTINNIKHEIKDIHQTSFQINIRPLEFYDNCISIEETKSDEIDFTTLLPPYKTIDCSTEYDLACVTSNEKFLLIGQNSELVLLDKQLTVVKKMPWKNCGIYDLCWSSTLEKFIVLTVNKGLCLINENLTSKEEIRINPEQIWWRCTCSDTSLYLITSRYHTEIFEFDLLSSFQLIKRWKTLHLKERDMIMNIHYNNQRIALLIKNQNRIHMELRSTITFDRFWSVQIDVKYNILHLITHFCLLNCDDWLVLDHSDSRLVHIGKNGTIRSITEYKPSPMNALLFGSNILIIKTEKNWNFHQI
jgi:hypothetical protein